jgi:predicted HTH transcriptional regulator
MSLLVNNLRMTTKELSAKVMINERNVKKNIKTLKDAGVLVRIGAVRGGHWEVR